MKRILREKIMQKIYSERRVPIDCELSEEIFGPIAHVQRKFQIVN